MTARFDEAGLRETVTAIVVGLLGIGLLALGHALRTEVRAFDDNLATID